MRYIYRLSVSCLLTIACAAAAAQGPTIDPTAQIQWNLGSGNGSPGSNGINCTQNGSYTTFPYGAQWGQTYTDSTGNVQYTCGSSGWFKTAGATSPGGPNGSIQYNNGGNLGGYGLLTNNNMVIPGDIVTAGGYYPASTQASLDGPVVYDTFLQPDGTTLSGLTAQSGNSVWTVNPYNAQIIGQHVVSQTPISGNAYYATLANTSTVGGTWQPVQVIWSTFKMCPNVDGVPEQDGQIAGTMIASHDGGGIAHGIIHYEIGPTTWTLVDSLTGPSGFYPVMSGINKLKVDCATDYYTEMDISTANNTVSIRTPSGQWFTATDANISTIAPLSGVWEASNSSAPGGPLMQWGSVGMGGPPQMDKSSATRASQADVSDLQGLGTYFNEFHPYPTITIPNAAGGGGHGTYRIAIQDVAAGGGYYINAREMTLTAGNGLTSEGVRFHFSASASNSSPVLLSMDQVWGSTSLVSGITVSEDGAGNAALDFTLGGSADTYATSIYLSGYGVLTPETAFPLGAIPYASASGVTQLTAASGGVLGSGTGTVIISGFNGGGQVAQWTATITSSGSWSGATFALNNTGYNFASAPTAAVCTNGTVTCSGPISVTTALGTAQGGQSAQTLVVSAPNFAETLTGCSGQYCSIMLATPVAGGNSISVRADLNANSGAGNQNLGLVLTGSNSACSVAQIYNTSNGIFNKVQCSWQAGSPYARIDLYQQSAATSVILTGSIWGQYAITTPTVQASPLSGGSTIYNLTVGAPTVPLTQLATQAADTVVMNAGGGVTAPTAVALATNCGTAQNYNNSVHSWNCSAKNNPLTSATGGAGTGAVTCLTATCTILSGSYSVAGGTFVTGNLLVLVWPTTTTAYKCWATAELQWRDNQLCYWTFGGYGYRHDDH